MDNVLTRADDLNTDKEVQKQLIFLLDRGDMGLQKWSANDLYPLSND